MTAFGFASTQHVSAQSRSCTTLLSEMLLMLLLCSLPSSGQGSISAKKGTSFPTWCGSDNLRACRTLRISSPDHQNFVEVLYRKVPLDDDGDFVVSSYLQVITRSGVKREISSRGSVEQELLWSPDSSMLFINESSAEGPIYVTVYHVGDSDSQPLNVLPATEDVLKSFPQCQIKKYWNDLPTELAQHPESIDISAIDWDHGSSAIIVLAEVSCFSAPSGDSRHVLGYELDVSTGRILQRMEGREFAQRWQCSMARRIDLPPRDVQTTLHSD